jgi:hypothetical protein
VATHRFVDAGATESEARSSMNLHLSDVAKMTANQRRLLAQDEEREFSGRFLSIRPTLDRTAWSLSGRIPGAMGKLVEEALLRRSDELRLLAGGDSRSLGQRQADSLVAICQDSLEIRNEEGRRDTGRTAGVVTVFVDARSENTDEHAAEVAFGPRVGPATLEALLCGGAVRVIGLDGAVPVATSATTRAIPPAIRDAVVFRDGGCAIDGCASTYRLEPHHIVPWSESGSHTVENLTALCWYHHHVAVHGEGFRIDTSSPPGRRRLVRGSPRSVHLAA